jgi:hypothetical protein
LALNSDLFATHGVSKTRKRSVEKDGHIGPPMR